MQMREMLCKSLKDLMIDNSNIVVIDADLAKANTTDKLKSDFPARTFNVGVAEQNMASIAAGLAAYGFVPFILSFAPFVTRRICDQIAISIAYSCQNVKIIGTDPGVCAELNGGSHMSFEDIAVIRSIPGFTICEPADLIELRQMLLQIATHCGPVYLRLPRKEVFEIHKEDYRFNLFKAEIIEVGSDVTLIAGGIMLKEALIAAKELRENHKINSEVINLHTILPVDEETILKSVKKTGCVVTCENHNIIGGIGSCVAEVLSAKFPVPIGFVGVNNRFGEVGRLEELKQKLGLTSDVIVEQALKVVAHKSTSAEPKI